MSKEAEYTAIVIYAANREAIEGNYGPYHDAVFAVYDENGEHSEIKSDWVRVYVDVSEGEEKVGLLLDLQKGDDADLIARKVKNKWKWFLAAFDDLESDDGPMAKGRTNDRKRANTSSSGPLPSRTTKPDAAPTAAPRRRGQGDPLEPPDEDTLARVVNTIDLKARLMQRIYSALANEFMADEDIDQPYRPTCDNLTSMTQSIFIDGVRDHKWMP